MKDGSRGGPGAGPAAAGGVGADAGTGAASGAGREPGGGAEPSRLLPRLAQTLFGAFLIGLYAVEVCPLLAGQGSVEIAGELGLLLVLVQVAATPGFGFLDRRVEAALMAGRSGIPTAHFLLAWTIWSGSGMAIALRNLWGYGFPFAKSGAKLAIGCATLGFFAGAFELLERQRRSARLVLEQKLDPPRIDAGYVPVAVQFLVFFTVTLLVFSTVMVLLIEKDFLELRFAVSRGRNIPFAEVAWEIVFVMVVLFGCSYLVVRRYAANLADMFALELSALDAVKRGDYQVRVPAFTQDEFARIASGTNEMIAGLAERERIRKAFGKYVSPQVAKSILASEQGTDLGGRLVDVAVLFSDLRNFTPLSESMSPTELVAFLNEYFTGTVAAIHGRGGVLDKFIGDAAMAVFGLAGESDACDAAIDAALAMREHLAEVNRRLAERGKPAVDNGIGVHFGTVVAGNIGSPDRLEYTVIGDAVNVASRLESATKEQGVALLVSEAVLGKLSPERRGLFRDLGAHKLKGKAEPLPMFGWREG